MRVHAAHIYTVYYAHAERSSWRPLTDVYETETGVVVQIEIAGMRDGHFHLTVQDQLLTVYGARTENAREPCAYHEMEIHSGDFRTEVELPAPVDSGSITAEYDDGFLRIILPKVR